MKKRIERVTVYGIDIGKNTFHVVGLDSTGKPTLHSKFRRDRLLAQFANTPAALIVALANKIARVSYSLFSGRPGIGTGNSNISGPLFFTLPTSGLQGCKQSHISLGEE